MTAPGCPLCDGPGGAVVYSGPKFRVIRADEAGFPAFYRLVWAEHVAEFSDLSAADRSLCMEAVVQIEECLRTHLAPTKVNLAALGNVVAHLHWHVIARFEWDSHFPASVWAQPQRAAPQDLVAGVERLCGPMENELCKRFSLPPGNCTAP